MGARTFFCHGCQCEKVVEIKVRLAKQVTRCRDCVEAGKARSSRAGNSLYSREFNQWLRAEGRGFIPYDPPQIDQGIREAYSAQVRADSWE